MSETRTDWTSAKQRQFTRENIARYPDAPFLYSAILDLLDVLDVALAPSEPPSEPKRPDVERLARALHGGYDTWVHARGCSGRDATDGPCGVSGWPESRAATIAARLARLADTAPETTE